MGFTTRCTGITTFLILLGRMIIGPSGNGGWMHQAYLREHKPGLYSRLFLSGKLYQYLADLNDQTQARLEVIIRQMQCSEGVDEKMKAMDQMLWVGRMNNIRQRAEEIVVSELVFS